MSSYLQRSAQKYQQQSSYYSPAQVDSDQKDVIIQQLKQDISDLKKSQADFYDLKQTYKNLENRYSLLQQDKERGENDFRNRNEMDMKQLVNLQGELEDLHGVKKSKEIEIVSLKGDNSQLQSINQTKSSEIQNLKADINRHYEINNRMSIDKRDKEGMLSGLNVENNNLMNEITIVQSDIQQLQAKNCELEDYLKNLSIEKSQLLSSNQQQINQKAQLQSDLNNRVNRIKYLEIQREDAQKILSQLNSDLNELQHILEQTKAESYNFNRLFLDEQQTGKQLLSRLQLLESSISQKIAQINDLQQQNSILRSQNAELMDLNSQLSYDLESLKKHIELITERNSLYLDELDTYEEQDELLRQILLRKNRVTTVKITSDERMRKTLMIIQNS